MDIEKCGAYKYIASPDFEILIIGYAIDDGDVKIIDRVCGEPIPDEFLEAFNDLHTLKVAHNAVFERVSFMRIGMRRPIKEWFCTAVKAGYCGLPLSLDGVSKALDLTDKKLGTGKLLIKYFSCPCASTKVNGGRTRNYPEHAPKKWEMYKEYNKYDVLAEREIYKKLQDYSMPIFEERMYELDQRINDKGVLIDKELAESAIYISEKYKDQLTARAKKLTGLDNPNSVSQIRKWIEDETGDTCSSLNKDVIPELLNRYKDNKNVIEMLKIRQKLSKTSVKKYTAMINCAMEQDHRVRGTFQFYGASRTGRWAGRLLQLQNMSKNHEEDIDILRELVKYRDIDTLEMIYDDISDILSQLVRTAIIAPEGFVFSVADFSAIEARVISWLANEEWRLDVFRGDGKIYEATGSKMFGVPISSITKGSELRAKSKIAELALGYEGGVGAMVRMGGDKMGLTEASMKDIIRRWRFSNPKIVNMWGELDEAVRESVRYHRSVKATCRNLLIKCNDDFLTIQLPSGRSLFYRQPTFREKKMPNGMSKNCVCYKGVIQETKQWGYIDTYGGRITENVTQAIARDLLCNSMYNLYINGYLPVAHIHDEVIIEVEEKKAKENYDRIVEIMSKPPRWAHDLPLRADGYTTPFYKKD